MECSEILATLTLDELHHILVSCWRNGMTIAMLVSRGETHIDGVSLSQRLAVCERMIPVIEKEIRLRQTQVD